MKKRKKWLFLLLSLTFVFFHSQRASAHEGEDHKEPRKVVMTGDNHGLEESTHEDEGKGEAIETDHHEGQGKQGEKSWQEAKAKALQSVHKNDVRARWKIGAALLFLLGLFVAYWPGKKGGSQCESS